MSSVAWRVINNMLTKQTMHKVHNENNNTMIYNYINRMAVVHGMRVRYDSGCVRPCRDFDVRTRAS